MKDRHEIFIIDDDSDFRQGLANVLMIEGYKIKQFGEGAAVLEAIGEESCPAVAIIDLILGEMNGLDLLEAIKKHCPETECILLTGQASTTSAIEAVNSGAYGYVQKPYDIHQFLMMLKRAIEKQEANKALKAYNHRLKTLLEIDQAILQARSPKEIAEAALTRMRRLVNCQRIGVITFDFEKGEGLLLVINSAIPTNLGTGLRLPVKNFRVSESLKSGLIQVVEKMDFTRELTSIEAILQSEGLTTLTSFPLIVQDNLIGTLELGTSGNEHLTVEDIEIAWAVADQVAIALHQSLLHEQIRNHAAELEERVRERTTELREVNKQLVRVSQLKDEFLANMSHELRTPLNAILGYSETLQAGLYGDLTPKQIRSIDTIHESANHLLALINDILDISKSVADKLEMDIRLVSAVSVSEAALRMVKHNAQKKNIKVNVNFDKAVDQIQADELRLKQILVNLLSNAVKFTQDGGEVGLEVVGDSENERVEFVVWDTGIGISDDQMADIFEPFVQLDNDLSRQQAGTGLGLVLASRLTELHNGTLSLESEVGLGSRFTVSLPWKGPLDSVAADLPAVEFVAGSPNSNDKAPSLSVSAHPNPVDGPTILLAEDNENLIEIYADYLKTGAYRVVVARNGLEALAVAQKEEPNLILIDVQMPKMNGLEVMRNLRAIKRFSKVPIIALTANVLPADKERCLKAGATDFLGKPSSMAKIMAMVEKYI